MNVSPLIPANLFAVGGVNVDFDLTFLAQFLLFTLFIIVIKPLLFDPMLRVFEEREKRTEGARKKARVIDEEVGELLSRYEAELDKVRREANTERDRLRAETARIEAQIMAQARTETAKIIEDGKARIASEMEGLRRELEASRPALASEIATRILGREVKQ
ncbi:MAG: ATP synthase F0 subunit B [Polyangiaceae bacterium]|nr:ATP synthase F0 subunit B [Polyangiaceae bacterium]NUQ79012.1 ATP synthase F0 subunit B [Polyangiaceae bacterium]